MAKKQKYKYDLNYLSNAYSRHYRKGEMDRAKIYSVMAEKIHGVNLENIFHNRLEKREQAKGPHGLGRIKKIKYG
tara:strand:+ start:268 stop:492 length:225 start_codon:yes stop_codon:yes gene_type:complete